MIKNDTKKRTTVRIPPAVEARIVELSMQHPEFGARRLLPLLQKETIAISASSIYNILKRHGLQNREKRFAMIQARQATESLLQTAAAVPPPAEDPGASPGVPRTETRPWQAERQPAPKMAAGKAPFRKGRPASGKPVKIKGGIPLALRLLGVSILAVIVYSGFHATPKIPLARQVPQTTAGTVPAPGPIEEAAGETVALTPPAGHTAILESDRPEIDSPPESFTEPQPPPTVSWLPPYLSRAAWPTDSPWSFSIGFDEIAAWLADARRLWQDAILEPYLKDNRPAGFTITDPQPNAIYQKMGLQDGDVIQGVNGEPITGPEEAVYFFQKIAEGGVVEIRIKRHRRNRYISLTVQ